MKTITTHYIDGAFVESHGREVMDSINPSNGELISINSALPQHPGSTELDLLIRYPGWTRLGRSNHRAGQLATRATATYAKLLKQSYVQ